MANENTIPQSACRLTGFLKLANQDNPEGDGFLHLEILARKNEMFEHWYFAWLLHDFSTMQRRESICVDFEHTDDVLGFVDGHKLNENGDLILMATLTDSTQKSRDIIQQLKDGIPLQASIDFSRPFNCLEVKSGDTVMVNGKEFTAPAPYLSIVKDWELCAVAICKLGYDPHTEVNKLSGEERQISYTTIGESTMAKPKSNAPAATQQSADKQPEPDTPETEEPAGGEGEETTSEETPAEETPAADESASEEPPAGEPAPALSNEQKKLSRFKDAFGAENAMTYLSAGMNFEQAITQDHAQLKNKVAELQTANTDLENRLAVLHNGTLPVGFVSSDKESPAKLSKQDQTVAEFVRMGMSEGEAQLAAGMKIRSQQNNQTE